MARRRREPLYDAADGKIFEVAGALALAAAGCGQSRVGADAADGGAEVAVDVPRLDVGPSDSSTRELSWSTRHSLASPTAAHIHGAAAGENGGVLHDLAAASMSSGMVTLTVAQATALRAGRLYANLHSAANPAGEMRGQILRPGETLYVARLTAARENPPVTTSSTGSASVVLQYGGATICYAVAHTATATAAHVHRGIGGVNGPVAVALAPVGAAMFGTVPFVAADVDPLRLGQLYVTLHTAANPGGELRDQLRVR